MICPFCGNNNKDDSRFCYACGTALQTDTDPPGEDIRHSFEDFENEKTLMLDDYDSFEDEKTLMLDDYDSFEDEKTLMLDDYDSFEDEKTLMLDDQDTFEDEMTMKLEDLSKLDLPSVPDFDYRGHGSAAHNPAPVYNESTAAMPAEALSGRAAVYNNMQPARDTAVRITAASGSVFVKMEAAVIILFAFCSFLMLKKAGDAISISSGASEAGVLPYAVIIMYISAILSGIAAVIDVIRTDRRSDAGGLADPRVWLSSAAAIMTAAGFSMCRTALSVIDIAQGRISPDLFAWPSAAVKAVVIAGSVAAIADVLADILLYDLRRDRHQNRQHAAVQVPAQAVPAAVTPDYDHMQPEPASEEKPRTDKDFTSQIEGLRGLLDDGIITEEEFEQKLKVLTGQ